MTTTQPTLKLDPDTVTPAMLQSLQEFHALLLCPLCHGVTVKPVTLTCAHTFCFDCIESYTCNSWTCPAPGCGLPVSARGARNGSYLETNSSLSTVVSSFGIVCDALNTAPKQWWNSPMPEGLTQDGGVEEEKEEEEEEEVVLQASQRVQESESQKQDDDSSPGGNSSFSQTSEDYHSPRSNIGESQLSARTVDSQRTQKFDMLAGPPSSSSSPDGWTDPIDGEDEAEEKENCNTLGPKSKRNQSCLLPSQSPGLSPINHILSQQEERAVAQARSASIAEISRIHDAGRESPLTKPLQPPMVLVASPLDDDDSALVHRCIQEGRIQLALDSLEDDIPVESDEERTHFLSRLKQTCPYALCSNADLATGDGFLVERTFGYMLAVACGLPIVYIRHASDALQQNGKKDDKLLFAPAQGEKNLVIGDAACAKWMAPQRALENVQKAQTSRSSHFGTTLLQGYTLFLYGDFDSMASAKRRRKQSRITHASNDQTCHLYSIGRVKTLLQLCKARVYQLQDGVTMEEHLPQDRSKVAVLIRVNPHGRDWRAAHKFVANSAAGSSPTPMVVVAANWLLDSIGDFEAKDLSQYTQQALKQEKQTKRYAR